MSLLRGYIRELLVEWELANDKNLMLDREGMEKSDRENVSNYLKSLGLLESFNPQSTLSVFPGDEYSFPDIPYPPIDSIAGEEDLAQTIIQYNNRVVPAKLQETCDTDMLGLFRKFLDSKGLTFNESYYSKLKVDLIPLIHEMKEHYDRPRPGQVAQYFGINFIPDQLETAQSPSYPSGHTIQAYVLALKFAEQFPEYSDDLLNIAEIISQSRIDRGVHFPSDIDFGRQIAYLIFDEMSDGSF
jgi:hypothetical protein